MHRSHLTQELQNYFPEDDTRVRDGAYSLDAQLLNSAAVSIEDADRRLRREIQSRLLSRCPANLDNFGVYHRVQIPIDVDVPPAKVEAYRKGLWVELKRYDDVLPIPARIVIDPEREAVPASDSLFTVSGSGVPQSVGATVLPMPGPVYFWVSGLMENFSPIQITITGVPNPTVYWAGQGDLRVETISVNDVGLFVSKLLWSSISKVEIRSLPAGAELKAFLIPFAAPFQADVERPYIHSAFRDVEFRRFWSFSGSRLLESYFSNRFAGYEVISSIACDSPLSGLAVEPYTCGLLAAAGTMIYYADRREPLPANLHRSVISEEPLYGLEAAQDLYRDGVAGWAVLTPVPYSGATQMSQYRFLMEAPDGSEYAITPDGGIVDYDGSAGWRRGEPKEVSVPMTAYGSYLFTLECMDRFNRVTRDFVPVMHRHLQVLAHFDMSNDLMDIRGLGFDHRQRLWAWTGDYLIPLKCEYDAYVYDADSRSVFMTESCEKVRVS